MSHAVEILLVRNDNYKCLFCLIKVTFQIFFLIFLKNIFDQVITNALHYS